MANITTLIPAVFEASGHGAARRRPVLAAPAGLAALLLLAACAVATAPKELPADHPANPGAPEAAFPREPNMLARGVPFPEPETPPGEAAPPRHGEDHGMPLVGPPPGKPEPSPPAEPRMMHMDHGEMPMPGAEPDTGGGR